MPADAIAKWLRSRRAASIDGLRLTPRRHPRLKDTPLYIRRGQAEVLVLTSDSAVTWLVKKFHQGMMLEPDYLQAIGPVLPDHDGLRSGLDRRVLAAGDLHKGRGFFYSKELGGWLDGTVLMPRADGVAWSTVADELRDGSRTISTEDRLALCRALVHLIGLLERHDCAHRDLSSGNVFVDLDTHSVSLIDFDSLYHPSLSMPQATTCGTEGYTAPCVWRNGRLDPQATWCREADRFALALIIVELLILDLGDALTGDGGMFRQEELNRRQGPGLTRIRRTLHARFPAAVTLFEAAIGAQRSSDCPGPDNWSSVLGNGTPARVPSLADMPEIPRDLLAALRTRQTSAGTEIIAPRLAGMPSPKFNGTARVRISLSQMPNPWRSKGRRLKPAGM